MLTRAWAGVVAVLLGGALTASPAQASGDCPPGWAPSSVPGAGVICIPVTDPGTPPGPDPEEPEPVGDVDPGCHREDGEPVECVNDWGVWVSAHQCWAHPVSVPPSDPAWQGHTDGEVWMCSLVDDSSTTVLFWVPPGGPAAAPADPGELARSALGQLRLASADVQVAPAYPDPAVVGIESWLWLPSEQWRPLTKTVRAGGTAVTVTAAPDRVVWDMGPEVTTCFDAGRPWTDGLGDDAVTSCGYTYEQTSRSEPGDVFSVRATIGYDVAWSCSGACTSDSGSLGLVDAAAGEGRVRVVQRQTVVVQ